jgi:hypothetical protein
MAKWPRATRPRGLEQTTAKRGSKKAPLETGAEPESITEISYCAVTVSLNVAGALIPLTRALMNTTCAVDGVV